MRKSYIIYAFILVAMVFLVEYDLSRRVTAFQNEKKNSVSAKNENKTNSVLPVDAVAVLAQRREAEAVFAEKFKAEVSQIAQLQSDPENVQKRLQALSKTMSSQDVQALYEIISNDKNDGDQRALAVEILSLRNDAASLNVLQNFVASNNTVNGTKWDRSKEFETVLRAQAVESIAAFPQKEIAISTLSFLKSKVDESFLSDRIGRATAYLQGLAPTPEDQDDAALKKLLE
ncbi:MAG: hypothetical protein AB7F43_15520 [Bacteriovoracia bacterium]